MVKEIDKGLRKAGINLSTPLLAVICLIFGVLLLVYPQLVGYIIGIFLIIQGILLLVNYMENQRNAPPPPTEGTEPPPPPPPPTPTPTEEPPETPPAVPPTETAKPNRLITNQSTLYQQHLEGHPELDAKPES